MSLDALDLSPGRPFAARLTHPELARLFVYWAKLARDGVPAYRDFDPLAVAFSLPHLQLYRRLDGPDGSTDYRLDLVGESAAQLIGANNRGRLLSEVLVPERLPERLALFGQPLASGFPIAYRSFLANPGREHRLQKRLMLPFAEHDAGANLLIAMVVGFQIEPDQVPIPGRSEGILETIVACRDDVVAAATGF
ncbi:MAG: hypothetical protein ING44_04780 [Telmatospirillum sp.]|nr:hypothetical protein [Telmatospirillum sp.]